MRQTSHYENWCSIFRRERATQARNAWFPRPLRWFWTPREARLGDGYGTRSIYCNDHLCWLIAQSLSLGARFSRSEPARLTTDLAASLAPVSFIDHFARLPLSGLRASSLGADCAEARHVVALNEFSLKDFACLISPASSEYLEELARKSSFITKQRHGKTIRLFAPLYLSNECVNNCSYCGFSRDNSILRTTLSVSETAKEAQKLKLKGFRNVLLVAGEHPKFISNLQ